jgi:hypothetical protein
MKKLLFILLFLSYLTGNAQSDLNLSTEFRLTNSESKTLNYIFQKKRKAFDFNGKIVAFTEGTTGTHIVRKADFFVKYLNPVIEIKSRNVCALILLTNEEKLESGGFDAVIMSPAKIFANKQRKMLVSVLKNTNH